MKTAASRWPLSAVSGWTHTPVLALCVGVALTIALFWQAREDARQRFVRQFEADAAIRKSIVVETLNQRLRELDALQRFYQGSLEVERHEFHAFASPIAGVRPGLRAVVWAPHVARGDRERVENDARREGLAGFQILDRDAAGRPVPAAARDAYAPVFCREPAASAEPLMGLDLEGVPALQPAMRQAAETGETTASEPFLGSGESGQGPSLLVFAAVYATAGGARPGAVRGFVAGLMQVDEAIGAALRATPVMGLPTTLVDLAAPPASRLLSQWTPRAQPQPGLVRWPFDGGGAPVLDDVFQFAGRPWQLEIRAGPAYVQLHHSRTYWLILPVGLALTMAVGVYLRTHIAGRRRAEALVRDRTATLEAITSSAQDAIVMIDAVGRVTFWNPAAERILGWERAEAVGRPLEELLAPPTRAGGAQKVFADLRSIGEGQAIGETLELEVRRRDRSEIPVEVSLSSVQLDGQWHGVGILRDITERKRAEERLAKAERRYQELVNNLTLGVYRNTPGEAGRFLEANPALIAMFEADSKEEFLRHSVRDLYVVPAQREQFVEKLMRAGSVRAEELELRTLRNHRFWAAVSATMRRDEDGQVYFDGVVEDITQRKQAEDLLRRERVLLRTLIDHLPDAIFVKDAAGRKTVANRADLRNMGRTSEAEVIGKTDFELFPPEVAARFYADDQSVVSSGRPVLHREEYFFDERGRQRWLLTSKLPLFDEQGRTTGLVGIAREITEQKQAEEKVRLLSQAVEQSPASIIITDREGRIEYVNPKFTEVTGYSLAEVRGQTPRILKGGQTPPEDYAHLWQTITAGRVWHGEFCNRRKDGTVFWEAASISPVTDAAGRATHFVAVKEDITELKRAYEALRQAKEAAEAANRAKSDFLANMSHEIRTPMNGVIGMTGLLLDTPLDAEQREYAQTIRSSGETLLVLINDVLDFSKIEAGRLELERLEFDLCALVEETAELLAVQAHQKDLELVCLVQPDVPAWVEGDPGRLRQVLTNLTGNAVKFTDRGEVAIRVSLERIEETQAVIRFEITDTGIGIPPEKLDRLFTAFTQVDASTTRRYGGTGLGLSISKRLVELMGGTVGVSSREGQGSQFWFELPFRTAGPTVTGGPAASGRLRGRRLLVVDDSATNRRLLTLLLRSWGCESTQVSDGPAALACLIQEYAAGRFYDAALLDMHMPGMDGVTLARDIKATPALAGLTLILLTSLSELGEAGRLKEAWLACQLTKPIRQAQLLQSLVRLLAPTGPGAKSPETSVPAQLPVTGAQRQRFRILLAEDNITNQRVALAILQKLGYRADAVANGREVLESLAAMPYDLVLMDCQMPEMDGYEAARRIRDPASGVRRHDLPVIALTAYAMQGDRERCLAAGMDDYVSKPLQPAELAQALERWLGPRGDTAAPEPPSRADAGGTERTAALAAGPGADATGGARTATGSSPAAGETQALADPEIFDASDLVKRLLGDETLARSLTRTFLVEAGRNMVQLESALANGDSREAMRLAHTLKGSSANLGAPTLRATAERLEKALRESRLDDAGALSSDLRSAFAALAVAAERFAASGP